MTDAQKKLLEESADVLLRDGWDVYVKWLEAHGARVVAVTFDEVVVEWSGK